jgi:uncharacterized membrane protein (UPF0182 family)
LNCMIGSHRWFWVFGVLFVTLMFAPRFAQIYVDSLWFGSLGYAPVFWYSVWLKFGLFVGFFVVTLALLRGMFWTLERAFSNYMLGGTVVRFDQQQVELQPERYAKSLAWGISLVWALLLGAAMSARWELFMLFFTGGAGGSAGSGADPIFNKPLGFFLFQWPVYQILASWLTGIAVISLLTTLVYGFLASASQMPIILKREAQRTAVTAGSLALAAVLLVYAWRISLGRFSQIWRDNEVFTGIGYTQAHILVPGLAMVAVSLLAAAAVSFVNAFVWRRIRPLVFSLVVPALTYFVLTVTANYVDNFVVKPNQLERQSPYIKHNIEGTRSAFALDRIQTRDFPTTSGVAAMNLKEPKNRTALENIRLWDWQALQAALRQVQVLRTYYDFPDVDVDRYVINGQKRQVMIAARELDVNRLPPASRNWVNDRLVYTHGYGVTMNTADGFTPEGRPRFLLSDIPVKSNAPEIKLTRPEIYFGQKTDLPVYVKTRQKEFDFPQGESNAYTTYEGTGGVALGGSLRRLVLAWTLGDLTKIPFSSDITPESRVLLHRNIQDRVERLAPFLTYDEDAYLVISDAGKLYWMIDAYTSSVHHPYSRHYRTAGQWTNYMRNSVKVVIDAYNGTTDFYVFDTKDPIINAYRGAFPALFKDAAGMPADLRQHVRYPEQLFRTQADVYGLYHMQDVRLFFGREDVWSVAGEDDSAPAASGPIPGIEPGRVPVGNASPDASTQPLDPYFVLMPLPGEKTETEFVQILPFTPSRRRNMIGWMAGRSDGDAYGSLLVYNFPKSQLVDGPAQIKARINQDPYLSGQFTLWNQQSSTVLRGNMLVIPLGNALLYVEPIFLQARQSPTPELRLVVLGTQERIVYGTNFQEALTKLLGTGTVLPGAPSAQARSAEATSPSVSAEQPRGAGSTPAVTSQSRQNLINQAAQDLEAYQRLTSEGRYSEAGQRLERVRRSLEQLRNEG